MCDELQYIWLLCEFGFHHNNLLYVPSRKVAIGKIENNSYWISRL